ncbi:MAG: universal stress protein [Saprospiraceae bacterium]
MNKTKKILFPTDFSAPAANAFKYALRYADRTSSTIEVLHVVYPTGESIDFPGLATQMTQKAMDVERELLTNFITKGIEEVADELEERPMISRAMEIGGTVNAITRIAKRDEADLIIMGSRGTNRSRLEKMLGSIAEGVVAQSYCPVIIIPEDAKSKAPEKIAYATNVLDSDPYELWKSLQLLEVFSCEIHLVHFNYKKSGNLKAFEELENMFAFSQKQSPEIDFRMHNQFGDSLEDDLNKFIEKEGIDLLVMYQQEHSLWDRLMKTSATKKMALHTNVPLLILKK